MAMNKPPGYHTSMTWDPQVQKMTGNPVIEDFTSRYGENLENLPPDQAIAELQEIAQQMDSVAFASRKQLWEAVLCLAHAMVD